jgi:hypothetical protein
MHIIMASSTLENTSSCDLPTYKGKKIILNIPKNRRESWIEFVLALQFPSDISRKTCTDGLGKIKNNVKIYRSI